MNEKYFITNEYGETVRVTEDEYNKWLEEKENDKNKQKEVAPKFQTPEQQANRKNLIDHTIEELNNEKLTYDEYAEIKEGVKVNTKDDVQKGKDDVQKGKDDVQKGNDDIQKENRERLDDDRKSFQMPQQQANLNEREQKIERIKKHLNTLNLKEAEMNRIDKEVQKLTPKQKNAQDKAKEEAQENGR